MTLSIARESPLQDDVRSLVAALNAWALTQTPQEFTHHMTVEQMADASTTIFVARDVTGQAVAMGGFKRHGDGLAEVKRMFTTPAARGGGAAGRILAEIERAARAEGLQRLVLETGATEGFDSARRLYERAGFRRCGAFLDYPPDSPHNIYYEKTVS